MQSAYDECFSREMGCTEAEWLAWLPDAIGPMDWRREGSGAVVHIGEGSLSLDWCAGPPRVIASVRLPRLVVGFRFEGVDARQRLAFMKRFDLYMQRGGG